jgi:hypothetical protein
MRAITSLLAFPTVVVLLTGCGANQRPAGNESARGVPSSFGGAAQAMAVFRRPSTDADALPSRLSYLRGEECEPEEANCPGTAILDESRLLGESLGVGEQSVYAYPTDRGFACLTLGGGGGFCIPSFDISDARVGYFAIDPDASGEGEPVALVGLRPEEVTGVDVIVGENSRPTILLPNGFFYELRDGRCSVASIRSLLVTFADGRSQSLPTSHWVKAEGRVCSS